MRVQIFRTLHILLIGLAACLPTWAQDRSSVINSEKQAFRLVTLLNGLENPWSLAFLPDGRMLVTERAGRLRLVSQDFKLNPKPIEACRKSWHKGKAACLMWFCTRSMHKTDGFIGLTTHLDLAAGARLWPEAGFKTTA